VSNYRHLGEEEGGKKKKKTKRWKEKHFEADNMFTYGVVVVGNSLLFKFKNATELCNVIKKVFYLEEGP